MSNTGSRRGSIMMQDTTPESRKVSLLPTERRKMSVVGGTGWAALNAARRFRRLTKSRQDSLTATSDTSRLVKLPLENTYKMSPESDKTFKVATIERIISAVLERNLSDIKQYEPKHMTEMARFLSTQIKNEVQEVDMPRYKLVSNVMLGQKLSQGMQSVSRSLWNDKTDNYACARFENDVIFAVGMVYGVYFE